MSLSRVALIASLKASLLDCAERFSAEDDADFSRHVDRALEALAYFIPRVLAGSFTVTADQGYYDCPSDLVSVKYVTWCDQARRDLGRWDPGYPHVVPFLRLAEESGTRKLWIDPAPSAQQISACGSTFTYRYYGRHYLDDGEAEPTLHDAHEGVLLLRAQAEAMKELSFRNMHKPVQLRDGLMSAPKNGSPAALYDQLMERFVGYFNGR